MIDYSGVKPTICPKCGVPFSSVFAKQAVVDEVEEVKPARKTVTKAKPRKRNAILAAAVHSHANDPEPPPTTFMNPQDIAAADLDKVEVPDESEDDTEENASPDEVTAYAEELKASLDEADVRVQFEDQPVKFHWYGPKI